MRVALKLLPMVAEEGTHRSCGTCLHYHPAPFRRQGWCRNPLLRDERELALVSYDEHRCQRMLADYWEAGAAASRRTSAGLDETGLMMPHQPPRRRRAGSYLYYLYAAPVAVVSAALVAAFVLSNPSPARTAPNPATPVVASLREDLPPAAPPRVEPTRQPTPEIRSMKIGNTGGTGAFLRGAPSRNAKGIVARADGTPLEVVGQETLVDGVVWRNVKDEQGNVGWIMAEYLLAAEGMASDRPESARLPAPAEGPRPPGAEAATRSIAVSQPSAPPIGGGIRGAAAVEFWLRSDARNAANRVAFVPKGTALQLIDSKAGEVLNPVVLSPAKWYWLRVPTTGESGWAYGGWVERQ